MMQFPKRLLGPLTCALLCTPLIACTGTGKGPNDPSKVGDGKEDGAKIVQQLDQITITAHTTEELVKEFERARSFLLVDAFDKAAKAFDRLMQQAGEPTLKALATFNSGVAHEGMGERDVALQRYRDLAKRYPKEAIVKHGLVRLTRLLGYLERWPELEKAADSLLARGPSLPVMDRIEGLGAKALALVQQGEADKALVQVSKAKVLIEKHGFGRGGAPPVQLAQVAFSLGEVRRLKSEKIKLVLEAEDGRPRLADDFANVLEARCQGLLDAQAAYTDAMRSRDAHWSAMSGYRVGQLYQQLHRETMAIPTPKAATDLKKKQLFHAAMRLRYRILLEKGLRMMTGTVRLGERTGMDSYWVTRAREAKKSLEQALADEKAALAKLPYTEEQMQLALEKLKGRKAPPATP